MPPTPHLVVDRDVLDRNIAAMAASARARGLVLRLHAKTHKCVEIAAGTPNGSLGAVARRCCPATYADAPEDHCSWPTAPGS